MKKLHLICLLDTIICVLSQQLNHSEAQNCIIPQILQGSWFSLVNGTHTQTVITSTKMSNNGYCVYMMQHHLNEYSFVFKDQNTNCYYCVKTLIRTANIFEKLEGPCVSYPPGYDPSVEKVCHDIEDDQQLITLFNENYVPINCRSSLEGVWHFTYQIPYRFTGICNNSESLVHACQISDLRNSKENMKFNITYAQCEDFNIRTQIVEYFCLGDWFVGNNHFFAVANTRESRKHEAFRCFLKNLDDDVHMGVSITAECNTLKTPQNSPEQLILNSVKEPGCTLSQNISAKGINVT